MKQLISKIAGLFSKKPANIDQIAEEYWAKPTIITKTQYKLAPGPSIESRALMCISLQPFGITCERIAESIGVAVPSVSPRLAPLEAKGLIRRHPVRQLAASGRYVTAWVKV